MTSIGYGIILPESFIDNIGDLIEEYPNLIFIIGVNDIVLSTCQINLDKTLDVGAMVGVANGDSYKDIEEFCENENVEYKEPQWHVIFGV